LDICEVMPDALSQVLNITRQPWDFTAGGLVILLEKVIQPAHAAYVLCSHCSCISLHLRGYFSF
jgi:hypothetical protein